MMNTVGAGDNICYSLILLSTCRSLFLFLTLIRFCKNDKQPAKVMLAHVLALHLLCHLCIFCMCCILRQSVVDKWENCPKLQFLFYPFSFQWFISYYYYYFRAHFHLNLQPIFMTFNILKASSWLVFFFCWKVQQKVFDTLQVWCWNKLRRALEHYLFLESQHHYWGNVLIFYLQGQLKFQGLFI